MKQLMIYLYILAFAIRSQWAMAGTGEHEVPSTPKVLIISSYQYGFDWSKQVIELTTRKLTDRFPGADIRVGYMNLDMFTLPSSPKFTLRSILWSYADAEQTDVEAEDLAYRTIFSSEAHPDVILFIGDDALLFYQGYGSWLGDWRNIPLVVCGASDYVIGGDYIPGQPIDFDNLVPIEDRRNAGYNLTGVKCSIPVRENLELIRHLIPALKEIVWVDNDFYSSDYACRMLRKELFAVFPDIQFEEIRQNRFNTDSIYNEILKPVSGRVYLTYSWDLNGTYSRQTEAQIRTLFTNYSHAPMFSLTRRQVNNPYWIGGYYRSDEELTDKTVDRITRVLQGEAANSIPFETVTGGKNGLDQTLLEKYGLIKDAETLGDVELVNPLPSFWDENETVILAGCIIGMIIVGLLFHWSRRYVYTRKLHREYVRHKRLYNKLYLIYGHTSIDLALYDKDGNLVFNITKEHEYYTGGHSEVFPKNLFEDPNMNAGVKEQIRNKQPVNCEITVDTGGPLSLLDSDRKIYQVIINPLSDDNNRTARYVAMAYNLSLMVREREEREHLESLVRFASDSSQVGIAFYNIDTQEGTATNSWYQNLNEPFAPNKLPLYLNVEDADREALMEFRHKAQMGEASGSFSRDIRVNGSSGEKHWIKQHIFVNAGNPRMLIELNLNVDEQKNREADLRAAKEKVEQSILATQEFLANINHEIRTPLNSIVGFSAILAASESDEERKEFVDLILRNNKLLTMLVDDVIELSNIDAGQAEFVAHPIVVAQLFKKVVDTGHAQLYNKNLAIIEDTDTEHPVVVSDPDALYRILTNLMSNAIKFTREGSVILGYRKEGANYYFYVEDTGKGVAPADYNRIFKRFEKLDSYMQGTGLGLAVCKSLVESLGGVIGIVSEPGRGSKFWFTLPVR